MRTKDFRQRTPFGIRLMSLFAYADVARRGFLLVRRVLSNDGEDPMWVHDARSAVNIFSIVYIFESLIACYPGWISMEGVDMKHMYEHHFPCAVLGMALSFHLSKLDRLDSFLETCDLPFAVGLLTQFCEAVRLHSHSTTRMFCTRTFTDSVRTRTRSGSWRARFFLVRTHGPQKSFSDFSVSSSYLVLVSLSNMLCTSM